MSYIRSNQWFVFFVLTGVACLCSSGYCQESRQQPTRPPSTLKQDTKKTDEEPTAKFRVSLKNGKSHLAMKTETQRNGNLLVTLVDGKSVTVLKKDLDKVEEITNSSVPPSPTPPSQNRNRRPPVGNSNRNANPDKKGPQPVTSVTLALANGTNLTATTARQIENDRWQVTLPNGQLRNVDQSQIRSISSSEGDLLTPVIKPNGEITWTRSEPTPANTENANTPATPGVEQVFYNTLAANANQPSSSSSVRQEFLAAGNFLESVEIKVSSSHSLELKLIDVATQQVLGEQVVTTNPGGLTKFTFSPALSVVAGQQYRAVFRIPNPNPNSGSATIKVHLTSDEEYVFTGAKKSAQGNWVAFDENRGDLDLVMRVTGRRPTGKSNAAPSKRALLVLLENDGIVSSLDAAGIDYPSLPDVSYMVFAGEGGTEFKLNKNESIAQAIARLNAQLLAFAQSRVGPMPQPPKFNGIANPTDPNYLAELNAWQSSVQAMLNTLTNPNNWTVRTESAETFADVVSDLIIEKFTSTYILQKTSGKYDKVVVLEDSQFGAASVLAQLKELAPNYVLDVHVLSHGGINVINGASNAQQSDLTRNNFFLPLQQGRLTGEIPLRLRAVYQCNCRGGTLKREWLGVGAQVVGGTNGETPDASKNNYMPQQYIHFLDYWYHQNQTMQQALASSFDDSSNYSTGVYSALSENADLIEDSRLTASGNGSIKH